MKVKNVMVKKVFFLKSGQTLMEAARILVKNKISGAPVVDKKGNLVGMISEKDLFHALYPDVRDILLDVGLWLSKEKIKHRFAAKSKIKIEHLMTRKIISVGEDEEALSAGSKMLTAKIHRLPVVKNKKIVGIVSRRDIFRNILEEGLTP
jgi:CBS domain-containing protein